MTEQLFDLTLTEDQRITRESLQRYSDTELNAISRSSDENAIPPEDFLDKSMMLGLSILPIPEAYGGAGMDRTPLSNALNAEDLGRGDMSLAIAMLTPLAFVNTVLDQGTESQQEKYLTSLAAEKFVAATIAIMEPRVTFEPSRLETKAVKKDEGYSINGVKSMVALGESSAFILVIADLDGEGPTGFIVEKDSEGLRYTKEKCMGLRSLQLSRLYFENVLVSSSAKLGENEKTLDLQRLIDLSRLGTCALSVGCCQAVLDYVIPYVNERVAFGEPISNRQSVAFMVANIAIELDGMRLMVLRAASRAEQGLDFHKEAYLARTLCAKYAMEIGTNGVQLLGGHGFCREHPVELWYRNLRAIGILEGIVSI